MTGMVIAVVPMYSAKGMDSELTHRRPLFRRLKPALYGVSLRRRSGDLLCTETQACLRGCHGASTRARTGRGQDLRGAGSPENGCLEHAASTLSGSITQQECGAWKHSTPPWLCTSEWPFRFAATSAAAPVTGGGKLPTGNVQGVCTSP
jgi:hypothetical protein